MKRVPEDVDAMKHLLKYGFLGTNVNVIRAIETDAALPFAYIEENKDDEEEKKDDKGTEELCDILSSLKLERYLIIPCYDYFT